MSRPLKEVVRERLASLERNPFEAARRGGMERGFINDILQGKKTSVRGESLAKVAKALDWSLERMVAAMQEVEPENRAGQTKVIARLDGRRVARNIGPMSTPEIDTSLGAGGGGYPLPEQITDNGRTYSAETVRDEWQFPERFMRDELRVDFPSVDLLPVHGDSMTDEHGEGFRDGDRVLVNRREKTLRQGGVFAIRDGDETIIKQAELIRGSDPPRILCTSLNERYTPFELILDGDAADIIGRVILRISRV